MAEEKQNANHPLLYKLFSSLQNYVLLFTIMISFPWHDAFLKQPTEFCFGWKLGPLKRSRYVPVWIMQHSQNYQTKDIYLTPRNVKSNESTHCHSVHRLRSD